MVLDTEEHREVDHARDGSTTVSGGKGVSDTNVKTSAASMCAVAFVLCAGYASGADRTVGPGEHIDAKSFTQVQTESVTAETRLRDHSVIERRSSRRFLLS